ncbi:MAG: EscU/YscU/HrcU family type III secretion system export apparatus switch protein [Armatimonadetes bacterium]|nr:EscU/YscU/HrcU family type III secretion system export apparatus switch protein [Armatimonadota bacterium]
MPEQPAGERTEQATPRRKLEARKKGTVAKSNDITGALGLLTIALMAPSVFTSLSTAFLRGVNTSIARVPSTVSPVEVGRYSATLLAPAAAGVLPLLAAVMVVGLVSNFAQVGFVLSGEALSPKLERLNPLPGFQRMFSARSTFEGLKAMGKMGLFGMIAYGAVREHWDKLLGLAWLTPARSTAIVAETMQSVLVRVGLAWLAVAVIDYIFQRKQVDKQLMMTRDELRREMKEQEGSPEVKGAQMRRRRQLAKGGLASKLKTADAVITNPTHFAIAIRYERSTMFAPMVVAKGADYLALRIRQMATDLDVPIVENKPLARALYKQCEAGDYVPRDLFAPVAEVLAYVYQTVKKVKRG